MTGPLFEIRSVPTFRDLHGRFATAEHELLEQRRPLIQKLGRVWKELAQDEAPVRSGQFRDSIGYRTFIEGGALGFRGVMAQPLATFIVRGTRAHVIAARRGSALRFFWPGGPAGPGIYFFARVNHPGTRANRFTTRAYQRWRPVAREDLARISLRYVRTLQGQARGVNTYE